MVYQGDYSSVTNYALGDVVLWQGTSYTSLVARNHGNTPECQSGQWGVLSAAGAGGGYWGTGVAGPDGAARVAGFGWASGRAGAAGVAGDCGAGWSAGIDGATGAQGFKGRWGRRECRGLWGCGFRERTRQW